MTPNDMVELVTKAGLCIAVRPANEKDDPALAAFFEHVSKDDLRFRFLSAVQKVSPEQIAAMTHVDHRQTEDFLVFESGGSEIVGNAMLAADKSLQTAEVAFTVHSDFKGRGIESALLKYVTETARAHRSRAARTIAPSNWSAPWDSLRVASKATRCSFYWRRLFSALCDSPSSSRPQSGRELSCALRLPFVAPAAKRQRIKLRFATPLRRAGRKVGEV